MMLLLATIHGLAAAAAAAEVPSGTQPSFDTWALTHAKSYGSAAERAQRREIFVRNSARFAALSAIPGGAQYQADSSADLTVEEFARSYGGCSSDTQPQISTAAAAAPTASSSARTAIDWRSHEGKSYVTHVKNQGAFGTCWSFGVAENLEGLNVRQGNPLVNISEQEFISCCSACQGRSQDFSLKWLVNNTGGVPALEKTYPYVGKPGECESSTAPRAPVKATTWGRVGDDGTGLPINAALVSHGPMGMGVDATCFHGYHSGVIRNCTSKGVDHAVLMVAAGTEAGVNYFTIKNSWGGKWGEKGFVRIEQGQTWWGNISTLFLN